MPIKSGRLTGQERVWAAQYARTNDPTYAAAKAGYGSPERRGQANLAKPEVVEESRKQARRLLQDEGALLGVTVLMSIAKDERQPAGARRAAANDLVKHSGISSRVDEDDVDITNMSMAELQRRAAQLRLQNEAIERERADRARPVLEHVPTPRPEQSGGVFG